MRHRFGLLAMLAGLVVGSAQAQSKPIELGLDAGFSYDVNDPKTFQIAVPVQAFRVGFFASERLSVEPAVSWNLIKVSDVDAIYTLGAHLGILYHFTEDAAASRVYLRPFGGIQLLGGGDETLSQFAVGGAIGIKTPVKNRLGARVEGGFEYGFENDDFSSTSVLFLRVGFSFMAR